MNEKNEVILEKGIKAVVWNFTLPDTPANDTAFGSYGENFWALSGVQSGETAASQKLTEQVYDMLLENRLSPYKLPYNVLDERAAVRYFVTNFSFFSVLTDNAPFHTALYNV